MKPSLLFGIILIMTLCSCIKEVEINIDNDNEPKIVVNCLFQPDSLMKIHVGLTSKMNSKPKFINNASIEIYKDGQLLTSPSSIGDGWYNSFHYPELNVNYQIKVHVDGYESVVAESSIPSLPQFSAMPFCKKVGNMVVEGDPKIIYNTYLNFNDLSTINNYYEIYLGELQFKISDQTDPSLLMDSDLDIRNHIPSLIFSNYLFRNIEKELIVNGLGSVFDSTNDPLIPAPSLDSFPLIFHSVSEAYYEYRRSSNRHFYLQNTDTHLDDPISLLFIGSPIEMYSNIDGGYGIFAGYNSIILQVEYVD